MLAWRCVVAWRPIQFARRHPARARAQAKMCGIAGAVGLPRGLAAPRVRAAVRRPADRGPDGARWFESQDAVLGMCRLAIMDVQGGEQPIHNEDRTITVVCNGELYNYVEGFRDLTARGHRLQSESD